MFKVVLLGEAGVGKSSIFLRLKDNIFGDSLQPTVGIESCSKVMKIDSQNITVCVQRSSADDSFGSRSIQHNFYLFKNIIYHFSIQILTEFVY